MKINDSLNLQTTNHINDAKKTQEKAIQNISSPRPIDGKDAASLAIADILRAQAGTIDQGIANSYDAIGVLQIADSTLGTITQDATRLSELSVRANSGILNEAQKGMIHSEATALTDSINQSFQNSTYNGKNVFENMSFTLGLGEASFNLNQPNSSSLDIKNQESITSFLDQVGSLRADIGAGINGINANINASLENSVNTKVGEGLQLHDDVSKNYEELNQGFLKQNAALFAQAHNTLMLQTKMASLLG